LSQSTRVTDRQTDGQTDRIFIARPRLHSMPRGKNRTIQKNFYTILFASLSIMLYNCCYNWCTRMSLLWCTASLMSCWTLTIFSCWLQF